MATCHVRCLRNGRARTTTPLNLVLCANAHRELAMERVKGSCLCGSVTFDIKNEFELFQLCHCVQCQKTTGSAHASNLFTDAKNISWKSGKELVVRFDVEGRRISNAFCSRCGSRVPFVSLSGKILAVPAGVLDDSPSISPQANIFWPERAHWYDAAVEATRFDAFME